MSFIQKYKIGLIGLFLVVFGVMVGEEIYFNNPAFVFLIWALCLALFPIGWKLGKPHKPLQWAAALLLPAVLFGSWVYSGGDRRTAYMDCLKNGEEIRTALAQYQVQNKKYPETLSQLGLVKLPGDRLIGGNILEYSTSKDGYLLSARAFNSESDATAKHPFKAIQ